ncbi:putative monooxygenase MoxC [compost metagenome]
MAKEKAQTLREAALDAATPREGFVGTPDAVASKLIEWFDNGAADGFILGFPVIAEGLDDFTSHVLPILEERGYFAPQLPGHTLRQNLGLPYRESVYAAGAGAAEKARA